MQFITPVRDDDVWPIERLQVAEGTFALREVHDMILEAQFEVALAAFGDGPCDSFPVDGRTVRAATRQMTITAFEMLARYVAGDEPAPDAANQVEAGLAFLLTGIDHLVYIKRVS